MLHCGEMRDLLTAACIQLDLVRVPFIVVPWQGQGIFSFN